MLIFGGAGGGIIYFGSTQYARITGSHYIQTTETIEYVVIVDENDDTSRTALRYVFYDEEGKKIIASYNSGFVGVTPCEGNKVTIYYNKHFPSNIETLSTPFMMFVIGGFFISISLLAFMLNLGFNKSGKSNFAAIIVGSIFAGLCITLFIGLHLAIGGNFMLILLSGGGFYIIGALGLLGLYFIIFGIFGLIKQLFDFIGGKNEKKDN